MVSVSQHHSFDIHLAEKYGIEAAIIIHHFQHWIQVNKRLNKNFIEGRTWSYQTFEQIAAQFPYWNPDKVRDIIHLLHTGEKRRSGKRKRCFPPVLIKANYNKTSFDRTAWYAFVDEKMFMSLKGQRENAQKLLGECPNGRGRMPKPIPDTLKDTKKDQSLSPSKEKGKIVPMIVEESEPDRPIFFEFIKDLNLPHNEKVTIMKCCPQEQRLRDAVDFATAKKFIADKLAAVIISNYKNKRKPSKCKDGVITQNKAFSEDFVPKMTQCIGDMPKASFSRSVEVHEDRLIYDPPYTPGGGGERFSWKYDLINFLQLVREFFVGERMWNQDIEDVFLKYRTT